MKLEKDFVFVFIGHTWTGICNGDKNAVGTIPNSRHNLALQWREFQSILEQVSEDLYDPVAIAFSQCCREIAFEPQTNSLFPRLNIKFADDSFSYRYEVVGS